MPTFTHLRPGNLVRWNNQLWTVTERTPKTIRLVSFTSSRVTRHLTSTDTPPPVYVADNATAYLLEKVNNLATN